MSESLLEKHSDSFVHLHLHTMYSLLDGAIRLKDLFAKAKEYNVPAVAMTDHGNMFGAIDFYTQAKKAGIKPIIGSEVYITTGSRFDRSMTSKAQALDSQDEMESRHAIHHLVLLCKNMTGYKNLCQLISKAYMEGFYYKPRIDMEILREYSEGLIATTACLKGEVGYNFFSGQDERAHKAIMRLKDIFGDDLYLEVQENGIPEQKIANEKIIAFAKESGIQLVATNDAHYLNREDATAQEVLLCIQTGVNLSNEKRMKLTTNEFFYKTPSEMREAFHYLPEACDNTLRIADKCNLEFKWTDEEGRQIYHLPNFSIETQESVDEYFARMAREGMDKRFSGPHFKKLSSDPKWESEIKNKYLNRLEDEIRMISKMGFPGYFLIVSDFIKWAKTNSIPVGPGRGSGAGSLVAYAMEITNIDPIPFNLLFERFINPERVSLPDFDVDFCQNRRGEVINYVTKKYGQERVGQIITFGKLQAKAVIRDVSRVYDLPYSEADMLSKLIPEELGITLEDAIIKEPKLKELIDGDPKIRQIFSVARKLEGLLRHASIHAAGVIITNEPLVSYVPLFRGKEGEQVVQFDKDFSEKIGLVKFDFLGLKTLTVIDTAVRLIRRAHDSNFDIENIDLEDQSVYEFISDGNTIGVFQLESSGMIDLCKRIGPGTLDDITAINALYRPGPLESGMVDDFIEIKHGRKEISYPFPELEPVLKDTYGVIVYQEQVMNVARIIAGYSLGQADMLRRAMGKKKADEMAKHREIFLAGAQKKGFDVTKASHLYDAMAKFAEYGFNKSHAVAYALIAYQTAFLKRYYPAEFFAALLSTELDNKDKVTQYIGDAKNFGVEVLPPDVNESLWPFNVHSGNIRFGMGAVKNVGENAVNDLVSKREEEGAYKGLVDFCNRSNFKTINKRMLESLIKVGAFDQCEKMNRKSMLENLEMIVSAAQKRQEKRELGQVGLFEMGTGSDLLDDRLEIKEVPDFDEKEKLGYEAELLGIFVSGHPLDRFAPVIKELASMEIAVANSLTGNDKRDIVLCGMLTGQKTILTKKGDKMAFATLEDLSGKLEVLFFPRTFLEFEALIMSDTPLSIEGQITLSEEPKKLLAQKVIKLTEQVKERVTGVRVNLPIDKLTESNLSRFKQTLLSYRGTIPIHVIFETSDGRARLPLSEEFLVEASPQMAARINEIFSVNSVKFIVDGRIHDQNTIQ